MRKKPAHPIIALAAAALVTGALAAPAAAGGDHGDGGHDLTIPLTERTTDELTDGPNHVVATGAADKDAQHGRFVLSFPIRGDGHQSRTSGGDHGSGVWALAGGVAFTGAGPDVTWTRLRVNTERRVLTARLGNGGRAAILRFGGYGSHHRGGGMKLVLTKAGAASLNRAAQGSPFEAGDIFAGGCR